MVYRHDGFWKCMDTQRDKMQLEQMWQEGNAPWKLWKYGKECGGGSVVYIRQ